MSSSMPIENKNSYILYMSSEDKIDGSNNSATFNIDWENFLPAKYREYKVDLSLKTNAGYYLDVSGATLTTKSLARVDIDLGSKSFCYDTRTNTANSNIMGYIVRDNAIISGITTLTTSSFISIQNPAKTMTRPTNQQIKVIITDIDSGGYLVDTNNTGVDADDMGSWVAQLQFFPISDSLIENIKFQYE